MNNRPSFKPCSDEAIRFVEKTVEALGLAEAARIFGIDKHTVTRTISRLAVTNGTRAAIALAMAGEPVKP